LRLSRRLRRGMCVVVCAITTPPKTPARERV
jgi:hypothetical protein